MEGHFLKFYDKESTYFKHSIAAQSYTNTHLCYYLSLGSQALPFSNFFRANRHYFLTLCPRATSIYYHKCKVLDTASPGRSFSKMSIWCNKHPWKVEEEHLWNISGTFCSSQSLSIHHQCEVQICCLASNERSSDNNV